MILATIVCAVACLLLVYAEWREERLRVGAKLVASLAFFNAGMIAVQASNATGARHAFELAILVGLAFGVLGDIALLGKSSRAFMAGLTAFLLGHIAYIVAIAQLSPPREWLGMLGSAGMAPLIVGAVVVRHLWPKLGTMKVPVIIYMLAISAMVIAAISLGDVVLIVGASLFFVSDLAVARDKFVESSFVNRAWGLPTYYAGQLLIAWSLT